MNGKAIADNPNNASRSKHVDLTLYLVSGLIRAGEDSIVHTGTEQQQHGDVLKQPVSGRKLLEHMNW